MMNTTQHHITRYPAYKNSGVEWLGEIPAHWKVLPAKRFHKVLKDLNSRKQCDNILSLTLRGVVNNDPDSPEGLIPKDYGTYQIFKKDNLVFKLIDLENVKTSRVGIVHEKGIMSPAYIRLEIGNKSYPRYAYYYYYSLYLNKVYNNVGVGVRSTLGPTELLKLPYIKPTYAEQTRIADFLDRKTAQIDTAIAQKEQLIALLHERRQILIHNAVTRGLNPDVPMKDSGVEWIGEIPEHWKVTRLKYVANIQSGLTLGKSYHEKNLDRVPYLRVANVQDGFFNLNDIAEIDIPKYLVPQYLLNQNDILVTEGGDIDKLGRGTVWNGEISPCLHQNHIFAVRCEPIILPQFLAFLLGCDYGKRYFTTTAKKTTNLASTNKTKLDNFPVLLTSVDEQKAVSEYIKSAKLKTETAIGQQQAQVEKLREYKATIINSAVTGKIKV